MSNQKFQSFIDLVAFDQNLITLEKTSEKIKQQIQSLQNDIKKLEHELFIKSEEKKDLKKKLDAQELEIKSLYETEQKESKRLEQTKSAKEYDAVNKELEHVKTIRDKQERILMQLWNSYEAVKKEVEGLEKTTQEQCKSIQDSIAQHEQELKKDQEELASLEQQRVEKVAQVSEELLSNYEHMRGKVSDPVVPVQNDSCSACFYLILPKDLQELRQKELIQCKECYRFLYMES